jgi:transcriptional regulator with XRE-family HTH domain
MSHHASSQHRANGVPVPRLAAVRKRAGLSQSTLAELAGVSEQTISRLERGAKARFTTIALLAQALRVPPARLLRRPHRKRPAPMSNGYLSEQK